MAAHPWRFGSQAAATKYDESGGEEGMSWNKAMPLAHIGTTHGWLKQLRCFTRKIGVRTWEKQESHMGVHVLI